MNLENITIYWDMHTINDKEFICNNYWSGNIIKNENGYFEGILKSNRENEKDVKHFVFGILNDKEKKVYKIDDSKSTVHIFYFNDGLFTSIYLDGPFIESKYGKYRLEIKNNEYDNINDLIEEIENFKNTNSDELDTKFYEKNKGDIKKYALA